MADKYFRFSDLAAHEREGTDFRIHVVDRASAVLIVAPHGGEIEPGTSQIAASIATGEFSLYCFEGLRPGRPHGDLHITSDRFDEPRGCRLADAAEIIVGVHGRMDRNDPDTVWLGGLNEALRDAVGEELKRSGFKARTTGHDLPGNHPRNICNRGRGKAGVQLELPRALRDALRGDAVRLEAFGAAVRSAIKRRLLVKGEHPGSI